MEPEGLVPRAQVKLLPLVQTSPFETHPLNLIKNFFAIYREAHRALSNSPSPRLSYLTLKWAF